MHNDLSHETFKYYGELDGLNEGWILPFQFRGFSDIWDPDWHIYF